MTARNGDLAGNRPATVREGIALRRAASRPRPARAPRRSPAFARRPDWSGVIAGYRSAFGM